MSIGENIRNRRIELGMTQEELATKLGYKSKSTINKIEMGINDIPLSKLSDFAKALNTSESKLADWGIGPVTKIPFTKEDNEIIQEIFNRHGFDINDFDVPMKTPVYEASAGEGRMNDGYPTEEKYLILADDERLVTVYGDSMEPTLLDGDDVVVKEQNYLSGKGSIYLVKINGYDTTLKRVRKQDDGLVLIGDNINVYAPHFYTAAQVQDLPVTIEGRVIRIIREL